MHSSSILYTFISSNALLKNAMHLNTPSQRHISSLHGLSLPQCQQCSHIRDILHTLEQRNQMQQIVVCRITDPAFDRNGVVYPSSRKSANDPQHFYPRHLFPSRLTFMKYVAHRAVIQDSHTTEIRFYHGQILDVGSISVRAMLSIVPPGEVFAFSF